MRREVSRWWLLAAILLGPAGESAAINLENYHSPFGVVDHTYYEDMVRLGAVWDRQPVAVYRVETAPGEWEWYAMESKLQELESRGLNYCPVLNLGQCWMTGYTGDPPNDFPSDPPTDLSTVWNPDYGYSALYYEFIYAVVSRFRGRLDNITIENEANALNFWAGTADEYIRVLKTAYKAAHDADPNIIVFDSGIAGEAWGAAIARDRYESGLYSDQELLDFVNEFYQRDVYFPVYFTEIDDLIDWLYSSFVVDQYDRTTYMLAHMGGWIDALNIKYTEPYWLYDDVTEWIDLRTGQAGYRMDFKCNNEASNWIGVSNNQLARELVQKYVVGPSIGVQRTLWFPLSWEETTTPRVALIDSTGEWMATGYAFQFAARLMGHQFAFDYRDVSDPEIQQFVFRHRTDPQHHLRVCWWDNGGHGSGSKLLTLWLPPATVRLMRSDYLGVRATAQLSGEEFLNLTVNEWPIYIEYFQDLSQLTGLDPAGAGHRSWLEQNVPNPFNPSTLIPFTVPGLTGEAAAVDLAIYDAEGRRVRQLVSETLAAGRHAAHWTGETDEGAPAPPGLYFCRYQCRGAAETRKMVLAP